MKIVRRKVRKKGVQKETECRLALSVIINASESEFNELLQYLKPEEQKELLKLITEAVRIYIDVPAAQSAGGKMRE